MHEMNKTFLKEAVYYWNIIFKIEGEDESVRHDGPRKRDGQAGIQADIPSGSLKELEQKAIYQTLDRTDGNRTHAAQILGISVRTLRNKLNEYREKMEAA